MKSKYNLDEIRDVITLLMRRNKCRAAEIVANEVKEELQCKGSNSTSGPLIRVMINEAILAEQFDYSKVSNRLKAAYFSDLRRVAEDSTSEFRKQLEEAACDSDEINERCEAVSSELSDLKHELATEKATTKEAISRLERSLAEAKGLISSFEEIKSGYLSQINQQRSELEEKRHEVSKHITAVAELRSENKCLLTQNDKLTEAIEHLREDLLEMAQEKADATARLEMQTKTSKKPRSSRAKPKGSKNKGNVKTGT